MYGQLRKHKNGRHGASSTVSTLKRAEVEATQQTESTTVARQKRTELIINEVLLTCLKLAAEELNLPL